MDTKADGMRGGRSYEWLSKDRQLGGTMTVLPDGSKSLALHRECQYQLCRENSRRAAKK